MKILGIDTATDVLGVAVTEGQELIAEYRSHIKRAHAERLVPTIERLLNDLNLTPRSLDGIAVSIGPGSFTGLRIGLAAVKGIAYAANLPVVGVSSLEIVAFQGKFWPHQICPLIKAQGDEVYTAIYKFEGDCLVKKKEEQLIHLEHLQTIITGKTLLLTSGIKNLDEFITDVLKEYVHIAPKSDSMISGYSVAILGLSKFKKNETENIDLLVPFYLKDFKAKQKIGI